MRSAYLVVLSLLSLSAQELPDGKTLLERQSNSLQSYVSYQYTEETTTQMTVTGTPVNITMTMVIQAVNPNHLRMEMKMAGQSSSIVVSDGETTWTYIPMLKQYSKISGNAPGLEELGATMVVNKDQMAANAKTVRSESLDVDGVPHDCWVVESRVAKQPLGGMEMQDVTYTLWIDKQIGIVLQQNMSGKMQGGPLPSAMEMHTKSVKHSLKFNEALSYSLFTFVPPADAKETDFAADVAALAGGAGAGLGFPPAPPQPPSPPPPAVRPKSRQAGEPQAFVPLLDPLRRTQPQWPDSAKALGIQGMVDLLVIVDPQGSVVSAEALTGPEVLRQPAVDTVKQWTFRPVLRGGRAVFAYTQANVDFIDFSKPVTPDTFGSDVNEEIAAQQRLQELRNRWPRSPAQVLADLEQDLGDRNGPERAYALARLAKAAVSAGTLDKASLYANELLASARSGDWNDGNAIHDGNMVRGLVALHSGNVQQAGKDLVEAGKTPGSPQLNSFGPNMTLASELLEKGERQAVLDYLTLCKKFWTLGADRLDKWIELVRSGGKPDWGANLVF